MKAYQTLFKEMSSLEKNFEKNIILEFLILSN